MAPPQVERIMDPLTRAYADAGARVQAEQAAIAGDPAKWRRRRALAESQQRIDLEMRRLRETTPALVNGRLPQVYEAGAARSGVAAPLGWSQPQRDAVARMAGGLEQDLLAATEHVSATTRQLIRRIGRDEQLQKLIAGGTAKQAAKRMERLIAEQGIHAVRYANGARHGLGEYAQMAVRTQTGIAYNHAALTQAGEHDVEYMEVFDGPSCIVEGTRVGSIGRPEAMYRMRYSGPVVTIGTAAGGDSLTVTPNHPVLTARGWVPAGRVREGDEIVHERVGHGPHPLTQPDLVGESPHVEDVFAASFPRGSVLRGASDFHGDAEFGQGEVKVVRPAGGLLVVDDAAPVEQRRERVLVDADADLTAVTFDSGSGGSLGGSRAATRRVVGGGDLSPSPVSVQTAPLFAGGVSEPPTILGTDPLAHDPSVVEHPLHGCGGYPESRGYLPNGQPGRVESDSIVDRGAWHRVSVTSVGLGCYDGYVYDLTTSAEMYAANGIVLHNCGWTTHSDPDMAAGKIVTADEAWDHLLAHPNCRRAFGGRPDVRSPDQAANADRHTDTLPEEEMAAQMSRHDAKLAARAARMARRRERTGAPAPARRFTDSDEAKAYVDRFDVTGDLTYEENGTLMRYSGSGHRRMNGGLRGTEPMTDNTKRDVAELRQAFRKARPLDEDVIVHRGVDEAHPAVALANEGRLQGAVIRDEGFLSTSLDTQVAEGFSSWGTQGGYRFELVAPRGKAALRGERIESELVFNAGTRFAVDEVDTANRIIRGRILPDE